MNVGELSNLVLHQRLSKSKRPEQPRKIFLQGCSESLDKLTSIGTTLLKTCGILISLLILQASSSTLYKPASVTSLLIAFIRTDSSHIATSLRLHPDQAKAAITKYEKTQGPKLSKEMCHKIGSKIFEPEPADLARSERFDLFLSMFRTSGFISVTL